MFLVLVLLSWRGLREGGWKRIDELSWQIGASTISVAVIRAPGRGKELLMFVSPRVQSPNPGPSPCRTAYRAPLPTKLQT